MKRLTLLLLATSLAAPLAAGSAPAFAQTATAEQGVEAAKRALETAEAALKSAEDTGGDIRAAKRSVAQAMQSLRAAEAAAGIAPTAPALTPTPTPVPAATPPASGPKAYTPPTTPAPPAAAAQPAAPALASPPAAQPAPPAPPKAVAAPPVAPPAQPAKPAPATKEGAARQQPAPRSVTRLADGTTETRSRLADGHVVVEIRDPPGRLIRRIEIAPNGAETVVIDRARPRPQMDAVPAYPAAPPSEGFLPRLFGPRSMTPPAAIPGEIDGDRASTAEIAGVLSPRQAMPGRRYTVSEVSRSARLRDGLPGVSVDGIEFAKGSAHLSRDAIWRLGRVGTAMRGILERWPDQVFLIESHTDAAGPRAANRQLSARRAASIAGALVRNFGIPQQNLVAEGYGEDDALSGPQGNRVTIRNITPLLAR